MAHYYQKKWVFTWNSDENGILVDETKLQNLLNKIVEEGVFQKERGEKTNRLHMQGRFKLKGPRTGKKQLLKLFSELACVRNLTFEPERSKDSTRYCSKTQTRVDGPWFVGTPQYRRKNTPITISLRKWQDQLLNELNSPLGETFRDRKVIWIQDQRGSAGKSTFLKYLCLQKEGLNFKKLPLDRPEHQLDGYSAEQVAEFKKDPKFEELAAGSLKIGDKNIRKIRGMKNIYEAKSKYARVYFQINGDTVQIILPALKIDQKQSIKLLKKYFK